MTDDPFSLLGPGTDLAAPEKLVIRPDSPRDPAFRERIIVGIIKHNGIVDEALAEMGVPWEVYKQVTDHSEWSAEIERITHRMVVQPRIAAGKAAVMDNAIQTGSGYQLKMLYDTAPKEKLNEEDAAYLDSMSGAPRNVLQREANKLKKEVETLLEQLEGGAPPSRQITEQIIREVSAKPKKAKAKKGLTK